MKNISLINLVTGGAGFVGSHLVNKLMSEGEEVICLDNYLTGSNSNIKEWIQNPKFSLIKHDVTQPLSLKVDKIWHLACPASPDKYQKDPIATSKICFLGTLNMLELAKQNNCRFLLASTSEVYGDPQMSPQKENYRGYVNNIGIRSCYDEGKRIAESLSFDYWRKHKVDIHIARIFNTFGPKMHPDDGRVISNFICQAILKKPITIYGDGSQTRSFCYIDDLIYGLQRLMNSNLKGPVNLGNPHQISILELSELIRNKINKNAHIIFKALPEDDPLQRQPDISLAKSLLNWYPKIDIKEGLDLTINYFQKFLINA